MQKTTPPGSWIEEKQQIYLCWEHYWQFTKSHESQVSGNRFTMITNLSELYFRSRRFILLVQTKKVISMNYGSNISSWKPWGWVRLDLIFSMRDKDINSSLNPLTKFTSSSRSTKFKDMLPWSISEMITKTIPISTRIAISYAMKGGTPLKIW